MDHNWDSILPGEGRAKSIILIADNDRANGAATAAIQACGMTLSRQLSSLDAVDWFDQNCCTDAILVEGTEDPGPAFAAMLSLADRFAVRQNLPLIISSPLGGLDLVAATAFGPKTTWLCQPEMADWIAALSTTIDIDSKRLNDSAVDVDTQRLRRLADEVSRIARALSNLSSTTRPDASYAASAMSDVHLSFRAEPMFDEAEQAMPAPEEIRRFLRLRRMRDQFFDPTLFADPAWDMLLDLMAARLERAQVAVSSLCIAAAVPPTTALRWIKAMTDHALFERCADPEDGRRIFIQLSDSALKSMGRYFEATKKLGGLVI
jgi:DNA-binding MarR family transcriptional regulator